MKLNEYRKIYEEIVGAPFYLACTVPPMYVFLDDEEDCIEYITALLRSKNKERRVYWTPSNIVDKKIVERAIKGKLSARSINAYAIHMQSLYDAGFYGLFGGSIMQPVLIPLYNVRTCYNCGLALHRNALRCVCETVGGQQ